MLSDKAEKDEVSQELRQSKLLQKFNTDEKFQRLRLKPDNTFKFRKDKKDRRKDMLFTAIQAIPEVCTVEEEGISNVESQKVGANNASDMSLDLDKMQREVDDLAMSRTFMISQTQNIEEINFGNCKSLDESKDKEVFVKDFKSKTLLQEIKATIDPQTS